MLENGKYISAYFHIRNVVRVFKRSIIKKFRLFNYHTIS
jgi:hypothetical protein